MKGDPGVVGPSGKRELQEQKAMRDQWEIPADLVRGESLADQVILRLKIEEEAGETKATL